MESIDLKFTNDQLMTLQKIKLGVLLTDEDYKIMIDEIANKYWEHKLKHFDFKSIQNDKNKQMEFIRNKYEYKKWADKKHKDPMTLIIKGKFKPPKDDENEDEDEEDEEEKSKKKDKKHHKHHKKNKDDPSAAQSLRSGYRVK